MKTVTLLLAALSMFIAPCEKPLADGFHFLKEWTIDTNRKEFSYVLTNGTSYNFVFCNSDQKGKFVLEDNLRNLIMDMPASKANNLVWKSNSTGIRYFRFVDMESNSLVMGFKR